jgi:recombination protein RecT
MANEIQKQQNGAVAKRGQRPGSIEDLLEKMGPEIARALPRHLTPDRMARMCLTALRTTKGLASCNPQSFLACVMMAAQLGLEPNTPLQHCWLIPRGGECTLMIGYQGFLELARRHPSVRTIYAHVVHEGDDFEYELGLHKKLVHRPKAAPGAKMTHVYCVAHLEGSDPTFEVLTTHDVERRKARGAGGPAWKSDYEAMAKKSAVRALWPWLPKSAEMALAESVEREHEDRYAAVTTPSANTGGAFDDLNAALLGEGPKPIDVPSEEREPGVDEADSSDVGGA